MRVLIKEKLSPHKSKTPEGYLICRDAVLARTGDQDYYASEIYPDWTGEDKLIKVYRRPEQVFSQETLASFENKPITEEHPDEDVNPENHHEYAVGFARDIRRGKDADGNDVMLGNIIITDSDAINDIENGIRTELSCGYNCDITTGEHPEQINIRGNHIALCEKGRAGNAKIVDADPKYVPGADGYIKQLGELALNAKTMMDKSENKQSELFDIYAQLDTLVHNSRGERQHVAVDMANGLLESLLRDYKLERKGMANFKVGDSVKDANHLPAKVKNNLQKFLNHKSTFLKNKDYYISDFIDEFKRISKLWVEFPLEITREKIEGWYKTKDGMMRKDYYFSIDGYDDKIIASIYANPDTWSTTEFNAYFTDSVKDELVQSSSKEALKKNIATEIKAGKDPKQAAAIAYSIQRKNDAAPEEFDHYELRVESGSRWMDRKSGKITARSVVDITEEIENPYSTRKTYPTIAAAKKRAEDIIQRYQYDLSNLQDLVVTIYGVSGRGSWKVDEISYIRKVNDSVEDDFRGEIIDTDEATFDTYRGYDIERTSAGNFIVELDNGVIQAESFDEAVAMIDEFLNKTEQMLRDRAIGAKVKDTDYTPYFKKELIKEIARQKKKVQEDEPEEDDEQTRLNFRKTKNSLLKNLREQMKNARKQ